MPPPPEVKCLGCLNFFLIRGIQSHLRQNQECRQKFSKKAFNDLRELCEAQRKTNISNRMAKDYQILKLRKNAKIEGSQSVVSSKETTNLMVKCDGCSRQFAKSGLMKHLSKKPDCKANMLQS